MNVDAGSDTEEGKKKKAPNMNRLLKTRLQKLVDRTDDEYVFTLLNSLASLTFFSADA